MTAEVHTQSSLQDYIECAYRYRLRYVDGLENPTVLASPMAEHEAAIERGSRFHRAAEQYFSGVPTAAITASLKDPQLVTWFDRLQAEALRELPARRLPEVRLVAPIQGRMLMAKVDLLAVDTRRAVIVDWKTSRKPASSGLEGRLQTRVYQWVVSQAADRLAGASLPPEAVTMRYWFAASPEPVAEFSYSQEQQQRDEHDLLGLIERIEADTVYPRTTDTRHCQHCAYRALCFPRLSPDTDAGAISVDDGPMEEGHHGDVWTA